MEYIYYNDRYSNDYTTLHINGDTYIYIIPCEGYKSSKIDYYIMNNNLVVSYNKGSGITIVNYKGNINKTYINDKLLSDILKEYRYFGDRLVY